MRRGLIVLSTALAAVTSLSRAQQPMREATPADFDFLEGQWSIVYNNKTPGFPRNVPGTWVGRREAEGRVLYDEFRLALPDGSTASLGATYRVFDHERKAWDMRYVGLINRTPGGPRRQPAAWADLTAWREGETIRVDQQGQSRRLRITYYNISTSHFSWKADLSTDGGVTWSPEHITIEATRVASGEQPDQREIPLSWTVNGASLAGTLTLPSGPGPFPTVIVVQGSGSLDRRGRMARAHATALPQHGIAVLTYDKRGMGSSTGSWRTQSFADLADDVVGGFQALLSRPEVDRERIGILGHSQGGWIAPLAAERVQPAFLVIVSGTPLTPLEQGVSIHEAASRGRGMSEPDLNESSTLLRQIYQVVATNQGAEAIAARIEEARGRPWFDPEAHALPPDSSTNRRYLHHLPFDFDVTRYLTAYSGPLFVVNGGKDLLVPAARSQEGFRTIRGTRPTRLLLMPEVGHSLSPSERGTPVPEYWAALVEWVGQL